LTFFFIETTAFVIIKLSRTQTDTSYQGYNSIPCYNWRGRGSGV